MFADSSKAGGTLAAAAQAGVPVQPEEPSMADYITDVRKYDATASEEIVGKIVKHLGKLSAL